MWRDPLDELIDDLEGVAPERSPDYMDTFLRLQELTDVILYGNPDQVEAILADPRYAQFVGPATAAPRQTA